MQTSLFSLYQACIFWIWVSIDSVAQISISKHKNVLFYLNKGVENAFFLVQIIFVCGSWLEKSYGDEGRREAFCSKK